MNVRNRVHVRTTEFCLCCRAAYKTAHADGGASNRLLQLKVNKLAKVMHYFSQLKLLKDCTADPFCTNLQNYQVGVPNENDDSNIAQFGDDNDDVEDNNDNLKDEY